MSCFLVHTWTPGKSGIILKEKLILPHLTLVLSWLSLTLSTPFISVLCPPVTETSLACTGKANSMWISAYLLGSSPHRVQPLFWCSLAYWLIPISWNAPYLLINSQSSWLKFIPGLLRKSALKDNLSPLLVNLTLPVESSQLVAYSYGAWLTRVPLLAYPTIIYPSTLKFAGMSFGGWSFFFSGMATLLSLTSFGKDLLISSSSPMHLEVLVLASTFKVNGWMVPGPPTCLITPTSGKSSTP